MIQQPQSRIDVDQQDGWMVRVNYYPTGQPWHGYTAGKVPDPQTGQLGPAMVQYGASTGWVDLASATAHAGYIIMMSNLALQLDRLIQSPDDLKRRIIVEQVGLQLIARFEEEANVSK